MYERQAALFLYCVSPVHMGAGTAIGAIDNPIQRERHTQHPAMVGSGIKGAIRHHCMMKKPDDPAIVVVFGPEPGDSHLHAGAVSFADAQIVLFPVRSLRETFVYTTCPTALARLQRLLSFVGSSGISSWIDPQLERDESLVLDKDGLTDRSGKLVLEAFQFRARDDSEPFRQAVTWLANTAVADPTDYFKAKVKKHTVLLHDDAFGHFVRHATIVDPHVRINDNSGTADEGALFYTENLPPESLLVSLVMATPPRKSPGAGQSDQPGVPKDAKDVLTFLSERVTNRMVQLGGDATTGRGHVLLHLWEAA